MLGCVLAQAQEIKSGYYLGNAIHYKVIDGLAVTEGDIILGTAENLAASKPDSGKAAGREAIGITAARYRWLDGVVPYVIDPGFPNPQRVEDAVKHWNDNTQIRLVPHTDEANYVRFVRGSGSCSSFVGMVSLGGQQISLGDSCTTGNAIHEIGHAVGLFHEQSRQDRDYYIQVVYDNLDKLQFLQYNQQLSGANDLGGYDYGSIMHYGAAGFSRSGQPDMQSVPPGIPIGQRLVLSPGDLDAVKRLYDQPITGTTITTFPAGLNVIVDGETYIAPKIFQWAFGTRHTLDVPGTQQDANTRNLFARWSDDGGKAHTIAASAGTTVFTANFIQQFQVPGSSFPSAGGAVQYNPPPDNGFFTYGTQMEISAVPNPGYYFLGWSGFGFFSTHGVSPNPARFTLQGPNDRYDANFARVPPTTIASDPPGLNVTVDGVQIVAPRSYQWSTGTTHTVSIATGTQTNASGALRYIFQNWSDGGDSTHTITATVDAATYTAGFKTQYLVTANTSPIAGGTLQMEPLSADNYYDAQTELRIVPIATGAYKFVNWSGDLSGAAAPAMVIVDDQKVIAANFGIPRQLTATGLVNAANFILNGGVAPGEIVTIFGLEFGPGALVASQINPATQKLDTVLSDTRVLFDNTPAPLIYVSANQISAIVPYAVAGNSTTRVSINYNGQAPFALVVPVVAAVPALFTYDSSGKGPAAALNQNGSTNTQNNPAMRGSTVVFYGTGEGQTTPGGIDGKPAVAPLPKPVLPVKTIIGGREAVVSYAGAAPGLTAGVMQINVQIPSDSPTGAVPVSVLVGNNASPANVTIWVR